jgi:starch phosphorylase
MTIVFVPDFRVSVAEVVIPAAELSEQISTAGSEASGTGNMKLAINGALTIGTLDGANIEMLEAVGADNMFIFGLTADQVRALRAGGHTPRQVYDRDPRVRRVVDAFESAPFAAARPASFRWVVEATLERPDPYFHLADLPAYLDAQAGVDDEYRQQDRWIGKAIVNVARVGRFSSDRTVAEYARDIWGIGPV